jgi:hypothetical protein
VDGLASLPLYLLLSSAAAVGSASWKIFIIFVNFCEESSAKTKNFLRKCENQFFVSTLDETVKLHYAADLM